MALQVRFTTSSCRTYSGELMSTIRGFPVERVHQPPTALRGEQDRCWVGWGSLWQGSTPAHMPVLTLNSHGHLLALLQPRHAWCDHLAAEVAGGFEGEVAQEELVPFCDLPALLGRDAPSNEPQTPGPSAPSSPCSAAVQRGSARPPTHREGACKHRTSLQYWPGGEEVETYNTDPCKGESYPWHLPGEMKQAPGSSQLAAKPRLTDPEHDNMPAHLLIPPLVVQGHGAVGIAAQPHAIPFPRG